MVKLATLLQRAMCFVR